MKKLKLFSIILLLAVLFSCIPFLAIGVSAEENVQQTVYNFLTKDLGLTPASACGIMGNIMIECSFIPDRGAMDVNDKYSYGLMMWNGGRYESLKKWCTDNKFDYKTAIGQLNYLKWELENTEKTAYENQKKIPNTVEGACLAAIQWADDFERCIKTSYGLRIYYALNYYWKDFGSGLSKNKGIFGYYYNVPENIQTGKALTLYGAVVSYSSNLKSITVSVYDKDGNFITGKESYEVDLLAGNIGILDRFVVFNKIPKGSYYYTITAENESGCYMVDKHYFTVSDKETKATMITHSEGDIICEKGIRCPQISFRDMVPATHWAHDEIDFAVESGLFCGVAKDEFRPHENMTRAMFVTVLKRISDSLTPSSSSVPGSESGTDAERGETDEMPFEDVKDTAWYYDAVNWAYKNDIVQGTGETSFEPNSPVTREQCATIMSRFSSFIGYTDEGTAEVPVLSDRDTIDEWAVDGVDWALERGIFKGNVTKENGICFFPRDNSTRLELACVMGRFLKLLSE